MKKTLFLLLILLLFDICFAASITKTTQSDFTASGSSVFLKTTATVQPGKVILQEDTWQYLLDHDGKAVCDNIGLQEENAVATDGDGGAIIVWHDFRDGAGDIYAQRIDKHGNLRWNTSSPTDGSIISNESPHQQISAVIVPDGFGGAIIAWWDYRNTPADGVDVYAQRVNSNGQRLWRNTSVGPGDEYNGIKIAGGSGSQVYPDILADGSGGAIFVWQDDGPGTPKIYARKVDSTGVPGPVIKICEVTGHHENPKIVSDGSGGAIIVWQSKRAADYDIYAQRIDQNGILQWPTSPPPDTSGVIVCNAAKDQENPEIISNGSGGALIGWEDYRSLNMDIYVQNIQSNGEKDPGWVINGNILYNGTLVTNSQEKPELISDGAGGAIVVWEDNRGGNLDIYAQRIGNDGALKWGDTAKAVCVVAGSDQEDPQITTDGSGGAIITWMDRRDPPEYDVYAQRFNTNGVGQWFNNGTVVSDYSAQKERVRLVSDDNNGAIFIWGDHRSGLDIYAQNISYTYQAKGSYTSEKINLNDQYFKGWTTMSWVNSGDNSITGRVKTAKTEAGLDTAPWSSEFSSGGNIITGGDPEYTWLQFEMKLDASASPKFTPELDSLTINYDTDTPPPTVIDNDPPEITNVTFDNREVMSGEVVSKTPLIKANIADSGVGVDPSSIYVKINGKQYKPDSFTSGVMEYQVPGPLSATGTGPIAKLQTGATNDIEIGAADFKGNTSTRSIDDLRVLTGTQIVNLISGPSPFDPNTETIRITYQLSEDVESAEIFIFNITGELVYKELITSGSEGTHIGNNQVIWNGKNNLGENVPNGAYLVNIKVKNKNETGKIATGKIIVLAK